MNPLHRARLQRDLKRLRVRLGVCIARITIIFAVSFPLSADGLNLGGGVNMGSWSSLATRYQVQRRICAWSPTLDRFYRVIASTAENPDRFELSGDLGDRIRFDVSWRDTDVSANWERLIAGLPSTRSYQFAGASNCPGDDTQLQIRLSKRDSDQAPGGYYSSTLTITLVAE